MTYVAKQQRYDEMDYRRCGHSGLKLPAISLGMWHNFGDTAVYDNAREMILGAFDMGITHFDLANNYGPSAGSAEATLGKVLETDLSAYRDELVISTKAGYHMWPGPYGEWGSKEHLISSLERSLNRLHLDYVDILYHHRPDPETPMEETADALAKIVREGKALYIGLSNYSVEQTAEMLALLKERSIPLLLHQFSYSMLEQRNEPVISFLKQNNIGSIAFSPLAQGLLTDRYLQGIPVDSRIAGQSVFLTQASLTAQTMEKVSLLNERAQARGQSLSEMALAWVLTKTTSVIIGASRLSQIASNCKTVERLSFTTVELAQIDKIIA